MSYNQLTENSVTQLLNNVRLARDNAERTGNRIDHSFYYALTRALEELQERRKASAEPVADVVAWHKEGEERTCDIRWRRHDVAPGPLYAATPVLDEKRDDDGSVTSDFDCGWNACRAAMIDQQPASPEDPQ